MKLKKQTLLWEVTTAESDHKSYLFGTMHVKSKKVFSAFDQIAGYIDDCDAFALEIDLEQSQSPEMQSIMILPGHQSLLSMLKDNEVQRLAKILQQIGAPPLFQIQYLRPMNLINLMSSLVMKEETDVILDMHLYQYAKAQGRRVFGIETLEEHVEILNKMDLKTELAQLRAIIRNFSSFVKQHHKIMNYYTQGRIAVSYTHLTLPTILRV